MKNYNYNYILLFSLFSIGIIIFLKTLSYDANTGDAALDEKLKEINEKAISDLDVFKSQIAVKYQTSETEVSDLLNDMEPAEILFAYQISAVSSTSVDKIILNFNKNKKEGWSYIIKELGIKKNTEKFNDLKNLSLYGKQNFNESSLSQNK